MFCDAAKTVHADFVGVTEANIDFKQPEVRYFMTDGARSIDKSCKVSTATSDHIFPFPFQARRSRHNIIPPTLVTTC